MCCPVAQMTMTNFSTRSKENYRSAPPPERMLEVINLTKRYDHHTVLKSVRFTLRRGERLALMGPSGSGKSTLLNCLGGIDRPDSGSIILEGSDLCAMDREELSRVRRTRIATVFQFFHLLPTLSAHENIAFPLQLIGVAREDREAKVEALLEATGMAHRAHALPSQLSGGEMQRVALARALAPDPTLILADEPTGNLDSKTGSQILDLLESLCDKSAISLLLVTHDHSTSKICNRSLTLLDGVLTHEPATT